jgi:hypothetical protein
MQQRVFNEGRFSYLGMIGDEALCREKGVPEGYRVNSSRSMSTGYINIGGATFKLEHPPTGQPADYLEAFDASNAQVRGYLEKSRERGKDLSPEELLEAKGGYEAGSKRDAQGNVRFYAYRDFPPAVAVEMINTNLYGPGNENAFWEDKLKAAQKSLEGFGEAALEVGDVETALEAYNKLGRLNDPKLIEAVRAELSRLGQSERPVDKSALSRLIGKIKAFRQSDGAKKE